MLRAQASARYGRKLLTALNSAPEHSAKDRCQRAQGQTQTQDQSRSGCAVSLEGFQFAAAEWWLMGYGHYHVISQ